MKITTKTEAMNLLDCLTSDFELLEDGYWMPEMHSFDASRDVVAALKDYITNLKGDQA